jgi:hypothetical protein
MNYAIVYLAGILGFSTLYWFLQGKKFYTGPLIEAEVDEGIEKPNYPNELGSNERHELKGEGLDLEKDGSPVHEANNGYTPPELPGKVA